jgi:formylglycine-generating enzyme required for sulfatase activity
MYNRNTVGSLRSSKRRDRWNSIQWLILGLLIGLICACGAGVIGAVTGVVKFQRPGVTPTDIPEREVPVTVMVTDEVIRVVTATPGPITPTQAQQLAQQSPIPDDVPSATPPLTDLGTPDTPAPDGGGGQGSSPAPNDELLALASELMPVAGGTFQMGTDSVEAAKAVRYCQDQGGACQTEFAEDSFPPHPVTVDSFRMERTEVTYEQYVAFLNTLGAGGHLNGCDGHPCAATRAEESYSNIVYDAESGQYSVTPIYLNHPVSHVTWHGAQAYCRSIGRRLPTEAEWERAARGANGYVYPWGNEWITDLANTSETQAGAALQVGSYPDGASPYGVLDMAGNVAEWVFDWYEADFYRSSEASVLNPTGPTSGTERVIRGGSWDTRPFFVRTVHRQSGDPNFSQIAVGFRCVAAGAPSTTDTTTSTSTGDDAAAPADGAPVLDEPEAPSVTNTPPPLPEGGS